MPKVTILPVTPKEFICPITQEIMLEPVATVDGQIYEKEAIKKWLETNNKSPLTNLPLTNKNLIPISLIKSQIQEFLQKNKICTEAEFLAAVKTGDPNKVEKLNYLGKHLHYSEGKIESFTEVIGCEYDSELEEDVPIEEEIGPEIEDGGTALFLAVSAGHIEMVKYLLKNGANPNDNLASTGWTVLQEAIAKSYLEHIPLDLSKIAFDSSFVEATPNINTTEQPKEVERIISKEHIEITKLLLAHGANPNQRDFGENEELPILLATNTGITELVNLLIEHKAMLEEFDVDSGYTALHIAAANGYIDIVNLLLKHAPQLIDFTNLAGETALHVAARNGHKEITAILLSEGADYKALNNASKTPTQVAHEAGKNDIAEAIPLMHQAIKRLVIKNATKKGTELEDQINKQQREINQLKEQLQEVLAHLNISENKFSNNYSPKIFK